ncbi:hypothetical protein CC78DRAFT_600337 [Lojkania enalia]|uniref:Uncharacterized protein n=1 Tax=Lojkania enalia TaxID=147567 RepID=A0A9P4KCD8_9PLEO|nr:hypothetical protein CC78DRAFT_600337 [Didymosphaeria enalia]
MISHPSELAAIQFVKWQELHLKEKPFMLFIDLPADAPDQRKTNLVFETQHVSVKDIRGEQKTFTLNENGFMYTALEGFEDLTTKEEVESQYLPAIEELLKREVEGADKVFIWHWRMRESSASDQAGVIDVGNGMLPLQPANYAHIDQGPGSAFNIIKTRLPQDAETLLQGRVRMLNIWKPLRNNVEDWPLAICDGSTVQVEDLVETDNVRTTIISTNFYALHSPSTQKWFYLKNQQPDEAIIFKQLDSDPDVAASLSLHAAFKHENLPEKYMPRKSIEVRAFVFTNQAP